MKKVLLIALATMLLLLSACAIAEPINVYALKGPTGIGMSYLMDDTDSYAFTLAGAPDEIVAAVASGNADIAACPTNLAATLNVKTNGGVQLLGLNTLGVLHVVTSDPTIDSIDDLAGRKVYATGQAGVPEYAIDYILEKNGLKESVELAYLAEHSELATLLAAGQAEIGILPEPHVTSVLMQNKDMRAALDVTAVFDETAKAAGNENMVLTMGCVLVRRDFAEKNPEKVAAFLDAYAASVEKVNADPAAAGEKVQEHGVMPKAAVAAKAIPNCHITFVVGEAMRAQVEPLYELLFSANPKSIGGKLPEDAFYYVR